MPVRSDYSHSRYSRSSCFLAAISKILPACLILATLSPLPPLFAAEPVSPGISAQNAAASADALALQRERYVQATDALEQNRIGQFENLQAQLRDYPLLPYLEYQALIPQLKTLAASGNVAAVDTFLARHQGSLLASRLERAWVDALFNASRSADALRYYNPSNSSTELACKYLQLRIDNGDMRALSEVAPLWNVSRSQPNICDPVFNAWQQAGLLTADIAWQRFSKTLKARNTNLARYIATLMPPGDKALAELYLETDRRPERLRDPDHFSANSTVVQEIILHGLQRLSQIDAPLALELWGTYQTTHAFDNSEALAIQRYILMRQLVQGYVAETEKLLTAKPELASEALIEWLLRDALKQQNWQRLDLWLERLPAQARASERWQYWQARSLASKGSPEAATQARLLYQSLAETRSFYGFLAADLLGQPYALVDKPVVVSDSELQALATMPAVVRARELWHIGDETNAQAEWQHAVNAMAPGQILTSGRLADSWGWYRNGIQAMIKASYWDDLQLRFPLAYSNLVTSAADELGISPHFLFAVARQESAFMHDVRSPAGALGLMQLMPATGQELADRAGMRINQVDLLQPDINIKLGSRYLLQMLQQFDGNRILAAAAYNAGPARVKQWLGDRTGDALPLDIWIETIPFGETRGYVQNVLAYAVIYGYRMGQAARFLTDAEAASTF